MKKMTPIHAKRLARLAIFLATIKPEKFNLKLWAEHDGAFDQKDLEVLGLDQKAFRGDRSIKVAMTADQLQHTCGTTACALGWAGSMPEFQKEGLQLIMRVSQSIDAQSSYVQYKPTADQRVKKGYAAGAAFFGLSATQSRELFDPDEYEGDPSPIDVTNRIEEMLYNEGYKALATKVAKCPRYRPWSNQYGRGLSLR